MKSNGKKFLYHVVYETLKEEILEGKLDYGVLLPSEREISLRFSVERTTVRKALQMLVDDALVEKKPGIGTKVVFRKMGRKKETVGEHKKTIGFFMQGDERSGLGITQPFYSQLFHQLEIECKQRDYQLLYSSVSEDTDVQELLESQDYYLILFMSSLADQYSEIVENPYVPVLLVNNYNSKVMSISYDNSEGAYQMMRHMYNMGHRDIAIISAFESYFCTKMKMAGVVRAANELGLKIRKSNIALSDKWDYQNGYDCAKDLLRGRDKKDYPTAIFAFNDFMAIGAIRALKDLGIRVPEDISVVGFDNIDMLTFMERDLTTMDTDISLMAKTIMDPNVIELARETKAGIQIITPVQLVKGGTLKKIEPKSIVIRK